MPDWLKYLLRVLFSDFRNLEAQASLAFVDPLTGLYNRRGIELKFNEQLLELQRQHFQQSDGPHAMAALFMDVDRFKAVNSMHGHATADVVLQIIAGHIKKAFRPGDVVGRFGGDEFVALMVGPGLSEAKKRAQALQDSLSREPRLLLGADQVTISIGIATGYFGSRSGGLQVVARLKVAADEAMYTAKSHSRNQSGVGVIAQAEGIEYSDTQRGNL